MSEQGLRNGARHVGVGPRARSPSAADGGRPRSCVSRHPARSASLLQSLVAPFTKPTRGLRVATTKKSATSAEPDAEVTSAGMVVARLGVASVDRVLREVRRNQPDATRAATLQALEADPNVEILGPSMVAWRSRGR